MNFLKLFFVSILSVLVINFGALAVEADGSDNEKTVAKEEESTKSEAKLPDSAEFEKIISEYKAYVAKVKPEIREEVIEYRKEVAKLNKQKRLLFRKLSQESQEYLKKEQEFKGRLPIKKKNLINMQNTAANEGSDKE